MEWSEAPIQLTSWGVGDDRGTNTDPSQAEDLIEKACREGKMEDIGGGRYRGTL